MNGRALATSRTARRLLCEPFDTAAPSVPAVGPTRREVSNRSDGATDPDGEVVATRPVDGGGKRAQTVVDVTEAETERLHFLAAFLVARADRRDEPATTDAMQRVERGRQGCGRSQRRAGDQRTERDARRLGGNGAEHRQAFERGPELPGGTPPEQVVEPEDTVEPGGFGSTRHREHRFRVVAEVWQ